MPTRSDDKSTVMECLARLSRVEPSPEDTQRALSRTLRALQDRPQAHRHRFTLRVALPAGLAAGIVLLAAMLWPNASGNGIVLADVLEQIRTARTAHLRQTIRPPSLTSISHGTAPRELAVTHVDMYLKTPDKIRQDLTHAELGEISVIFDEKHQATLLSSKKLCHIEPNAMIPSVQLQRILAFLYPGGTGPERFEEFAEEESGTLSFDKVVRRDGRKLLRYRYEPPATKAEQPDAKKVNLYYWFDESTQALSMRTQETLVNGQWVETTTTSVGLNVDLPDSLFSTDPPPGYTAVPKAALSRGMSDDVRAVLVEYAQAGGRIQRYRLIVWEDGRENRYPSFRALCDGDLWRVDAVGARDTAGQLIQPLEDFDAVWNQLSPARHGNTALILDGRPATIRRLTDRTTSEWSRDPNLYRYLLIELGWPEWPSDTNFTAVDGPSVLFHHLPDQADRPGLLGVRHESNYPHRAGTSQNMHVYWLDPTRDYLCVRHEVHQRQGHPPWRGKLDWTPGEPEGDSADRPSGASDYDFVAEITEFGQTSAGRWYPKTIKHTNAYVADGKRYSFPPRFEYIQLDTNGNVPPEELSDWPPEVPKPE